MIVTDEIQKAERILLLQSPITRSDIYLLIRYYNNKKFKPLQIKDTIGKLIEKRNNGDDNFYLYDYLEKSIKNARKYKIKDGIMTVGISKSEIDRIKHLPHQYYKLLLYILIIAKYDKYKREIKKDNKRYKYGLYFNHSLLDACNSCGMNFSKKRVDELNSFLGELKLLSATLTSESRWQVLYSDEEKAKYAIKIENLFEQFPYFCLRCFKQYDKKNERIDLCEECRTVKRKYEVRHNVKKYRQKEK